MARPLALVLLALATLASLAAFLGSPLAPWLAALGGATFPVSLIALGAARRGRLGPLEGRLRLPLALLWLLLAGGLAAVLALPAGGPDVAGLPLATALMIFVLVPVPLLGLGLLYALSFNRLGVREEDLDRMRRLRRSGGDS